MCVCCFLGFSQKESGKAKKHAKIFGRSGIKTYICNVIMTLCQTFN